MCGRPTAPAWNCMRGTAFARSGCAATITPRRAAAKTRSCSRWSSRLDSSRRALFLREMGLSPVWRLRGEDSAPGMLASEQPRIATGRIAAEVSAQVSAQPEVAQVPALMQDDRNARIMRMEWAELTAAVATCQACPLAKTRTNTVFGVGDQQADWLIIGEAPGAEEDARGEPFVGQAGKLLDNMFASVGMKRGDNVYIANVLKCRTTVNRKPQPQSLGGGAVRPAPSAPDRAHPSQAHHRDGALRRAGAARDRCHHCKPARQAASVSGRAADSQLSPGLP